MKKHIPNFLTCCNLMVGAVGIIWVFQDYQPELLFLLILVGAFFDLLDGLVARALKVQSEIGKQLDSLADLVTFGVLPALALFQFNYSAISEPFRLEALFSLEAVPILIIPFSALRLAKFNISNDQSNEFRGLPTPANALMVAGALLLNSAVLNPQTVAIISVLSCFLLISDIRMIAFKFSGPKWKGNELRYILLIILWIGIGAFRVSFIPFVIPTYIAFSIIGNYILQPVLFK